MRIYMIGFDIETTKVTAEIIDYPIDSSNTYNELLKVLKCDSLEFVDFNNEIVMIIDEFGKFKRHNPVFQVVTDSGGNLKVAGKILFAKNVENEFSTDIGGIELFEIEQLRNSLDIQIIGITK